MSRRDIHHLPEIRISPTRHGAFAYKRNSDSKSGYARCIAIRINPPQCIVRYRAAFIEPETIVRVSALLLCAAFACSATTTCIQAADIPSQDVPGAHDHAVVSRFAGSVIVGYRQQDYAELTIPLGKYDGDQPSHFTKSEQVEGRLTRIAYAAPEGKTAIEVFDNFRQALRNAGFVIRFQCSGDADCGSGYRFAGELADPANEAMHGGNSNLIVYLLDAANGNVHALTARLERPSGRIDLSLLVSEDDNQPPGILLQIVEGRAMATGQVTVDAKAMRQGLDHDGHIALYGIHFASDSAILASSSDPTLAQMAALLKAKPALKVYVVGHTDNSGPLAHNLSLSQQRAEAVVHALTTRYGIAASRLVAKGLASFAPVASNLDDRGKARNRRVELVAQ